MSDLSALAIEIRSCREAKGWDQATFGEQLGVSKETISAWGNSIKLPRPFHIKLIRDIFNISENDMRSLLRDAHHKRESGSGDYDIQDYHFVSQNFNSYEDFLDRLIALDNETVDFLTDETEGNSKQWAPIFEAHKHTWKLLIHDGEIVGYWHFIPLKEDLFIRSYSGTLLESEIKMSDTVPIIGPGNYNIFISMITVAHDHRIHGSYILERNFIATMKKFTNARIFFSGISACALSIDGLAICDKLGMEDMGRCEFAQDLEIAQAFLTDGKNISQNGILSKMPQIKKRYSDHFKAHTWLPAGVQKS